MDDGKETFSLDNIDISNLTNIKKELEEMSSEYGISVDTSEYDNLLNVLMDTSSTADQVKAAFSSLATSIINSSGVVNVTEENFNALKQSLASLGVTNADEVLLSILNVKNELVAKGYNLVDITNAEAQAIINEGIVSAETAEYLRYYMIQKSLAENPLSTVADVEALEALCNSLGVTGEMLQAVISLKSALGAVEAGAPIEAFQGQIDSANAKIAELIANGSSFKFDFSSIGCNASKAGKEDICGNIIHITKTETIYQDENGVTHYDIKNVPKTEAGIRDVIVPDNCVWILDKIRKLCPFGQYVFMQDGERIRSYVFRTRLYSNCKKLQIVVKSPHKVRKTYGSKLYDADTITESFMIEQMGHTDITCLKKHYYYNRMSNNEKKDMLNQAAVL